MAVPQNLDDAFIVLVYAKHLAATGSVYWNAGAGRVDGFTSVLDVLLKAAMLAITRADGLRLAWLATAGALVASVLVSASLCLRAAADDRVSRLIAGLGVLAAASNVALMQGASYLLETSLFALVALVAVRGVSRRRSLRAGSLAALAAQWIVLAAARPEGFVLALFAAAFFVWTHFRRPVLARLLAPAAALLVAAAIYLGWHRVYFGALAPNTFYAKASDSRLDELRDGLDYVARFAATPGSAVLVAGLFASPLLLALRRPWDSRRSRRAFAAASLGAWIGAVVVVVEGGDGYPGGRFLAAPAALLIVALTTAGARLRGPWRAGVSAALGLVLIESAGIAFGEPRTALAGMRSWPLDAREFPCDRGAVAQLERAGVRTLAETDYQRAKYYADDLRVVDLSGLNDVAIAHRPCAGHNLWGKADFDDAPATGADVLQLGALYMHDVPIGAFSMADLFTRPRVAAAYFGHALEPSSREAFDGYVPVSFVVCAGEFFDVLVRRDVAARLNGPGVVLAGRELPPARP